MVFTPSIKQNVFEFKVTASKKTFSLPLMQYISAALADDIESAMFKLKPYAAEMQRIQALPADERETAEIPEGFDPAIIADLKSLQRQIFERYAPGVFEVASMAEVRAIWAEWQRASGIDMGKSSASSPS